MPQYQKIASLAECEWESWLSAGESQLSHWFEPAQGIFIAESPNVIARALAAGYEPLSYLVDAKSCTDQVTAILEQSSSVPVYLADQDIMNSITGVHLTQGILCAMRRRKMNLESYAMLDGMHRIALLENVMNPTNLGAIFRSAAAMGVDAILMTKGCTDPLYRRAVRVSMGTVFQVQWSIWQEQTAARAVEMLRKHCGFHSAAMALYPNARRIDDTQIKSAEKLVIVLGTEGEGLEQETIDACDWTVQIPMSHGVDSLNVAAASAVAFWELRYPS